MVTAATIYMSLLGPAGLRRVALACHGQTRALAAAAAAIPGVDLVFAGPYFHEVVLRLPAAAENVLGAMAEQGILGGVLLEPWYPSLQNCVLVCATETKTDEDIERYALVLSAAIQQAGTSR